MVIKVAMRIFELTKSFPPETKQFNLIDKMRRTIRGICTNFAEAWRKRIYKVAFISKPNDAYLYIIKKIDNKK